MIDNPATINIVSEFSTLSGKLDVNIIPVDEDGESEVPDDLAPENPMELVN